MSAAAKGYAVKDEKGNILVHTVSPTEIGAKANWLFADCRIPVGASVKDGQIRSFFDLLHEHAGVSLARVQISEVSE